MLSCSFRIQPNTDTRTKQIEDWCDLLLNYFKFHLLYKLDVMDAQTIPLFQNHAIGRIFLFGGNWLPNWLPFLVSIFSLILCTYVLLCCLASLRTSLMHFGILICFVYDHLFSFIICILYHFYDILSLVWLQLKSCNVIPFNALSSFYFKGSCGLNSKSSKVN